MKSLQTVQRQTGFETLEAKKLFAADLTGGAAIDLPDTAIVDGFDIASPATGLLSPASIGLLNANLGGQEGEDVTGDTVSGIAAIDTSGIASDNVAATLADGDGLMNTKLGGQEGEPLVGGNVSFNCHATPAAHSISMANTAEGGLTDHSPSGPVASLKSKTSEARTNFTDNGLDSSDLVADIHGDPYFAVDALYHSKELELTTNLDGQEGEDFNLDPGDAVSGVAAVHTSGVVDSLASSKTSEFLHDNTNNAISMSNTAEGALGEISEAIIRMRELAVQSANGDFQVTDQHYFAVR